VLVQGCSLDGHLMSFRGVQICFSRHESLLQYFHEEQLLNLWARLGYLCCVVPSTVHDDPEIITLQTIKIVKIIISSSSNTLLRSCQTATMQKMKKKYSTIDYHPIIQILKYYKLFYISAVSSVHLQ